MCSFCLGPDVTWGLSLRLASLVTHEIPSRVKPKPNQGQEPVSESTLSLLTSPRSTNLAAAAQNICLTEGRVCSGPQVAKHSHYACLRL